MRRAHLVTLLVLPTLLAVAGNAFAAGFSIREQSSTAQGTAFAGSTAGALDPSYMFFNPAALAYQEGRQAQISVSLIDAHSRLQRSSGSTVTGTPITGSDTAGDIAGNAVAPAFYASIEPVAGWHLGLGVNSPFGLETSYSDDWVGRYHAIDSRLGTVNINPAIAWRAAPWLSLAAGLQVQRVDARLTNAIDFGTIGALGGFPGAVPAGDDGRAELQGDDWGVGYDLGVIVEPRPGTRLGVSYRSAIDQTLRGRTDYTLDQAGVGAFLKGTQGLFTNGNATAKLETPASLSVGLYQTVSERWAVMADLAWTDWSVFKELRVKFDNPAQPDNVTEQNWTDSWFAALGTTWKATDTLTFRAGVAYDKSPVTDANTTPRVPDSDRYWVAAGVTYAPRSWISLDLALTHIFMPNATVDLSTSGTDNTVRGNLSARYDNSIDIIVLGARVTF
jgi:long-chain fatty acid transport protein